MDQTIIYLFDACVYELLLNTEIGSHLSFWLIFVLYQFFFLTTSRTIKVSLLYNFIFYLNMFHNYNSERKTVEITSLGAPLGCFFLSMMNFVEDSRYNFLSVSKLSISPCCRIILEFISKKER